MKILRPVVPLTDRRFKYVPAVATNLRVTFARERERLRALQEATNVTPIRREGSA